MKVIPVNKTAYLAAQPPTYCSKCSDIEQGIFFFHMMPGDCWTEKKTYNFCPDCGYNLREVKQE